MSFRDVLAYEIGQAIWGTAIALDPGEAKKSYRAADVALALIPQTPTPSSPQCCGLPLDDEGRCVHRPWHIQKNAAPSSPRTFELVRHHDVSGQTGTGVVAEGVQFSDLTAALRWRGGHPATAVWPNVEEILAVHGHGGLTELRWLEE